jgi:hypothetical protein
MSQSLREQKDPALLVCPIPHIRQEADRSLNGGSLCRRSRGLRRERADADHPQLCGALIRRRLAKWLKIRTASNPRVERNAGYLCSTISEREMATVLSTRNRSSALSVRRLNGVNPRNICGDAEDLILAGRSQSLCDASADFAGRALMISKGS